MATFKELGDKLEIKLKTISNFKIGKTGQSIEERYNQEYSDIYASYEEIVSSLTPEIIDNFEKYLIERFQNIANCDNEQSGGGKMAKSNRYIVYLMYNK